MLINQINDHLYNTYSRRNTGHSVMPQMSFRGLKSDVVQISRKFEELPIKEQRLTLFETLQKSQLYSDEKIEELMKYKDESLPLVKELSEITKAGEVAFYNMCEEDLPARIEFYKRYKEEQPVYFMQDLKVLSGINRYNLPLVKLIGITSFYTDDEIKLIQNTNTKEDADAKIEGYKTLRYAIYEESLSYKWAKSDLYKVLNNTSMCHLPLLNRMCKNKNYIAYPGNIIKVLNNTDINNIESKIKIFDVMEDINPESNDVDVLKYTDNDNYSLVEFLLKYKDLPWNYIPDILKSVTSKDLADIKLNAYNTIKNRKDAKNNTYSFAKILINIGYNNKKIFDALVSDRKFRIIDIARILEHDINNKEKESLFLRLINEKEMSSDETEKIIDTLLSYNLKLAEKVCFDSYFTTQDKINFLNSIYFEDDCKDFKYCDFLNELDLHKLYDNYKKIRQTALNNPEMYINGDGKNYDEMVGIIDAFFERNMAGIMGSTHIFDMKTTDDLLRMRLDYAEDYLEKFVVTDIENLELLKKICSAAGIDETPLSSKQKLEMINILEAYHDNNMSINKIKEMAEKGVVDVNELNMDLLKEIFSNLDIDVFDIPKEKLLSWDLKYIHLLASELEYSDWERKEQFKTVINTANSETSFKDFIQDPTNEYGYNNKATMLDFKELKMNYDKWVNPDKKNNIHFMYKDENKEKLAQISNQIEEDINTLLHSPVKDFVKKQFPQLIKYTGKYYKQTDVYSDSVTDIDIAFEIPADDKISKSKLEKLVKMLSDTSKNGQLAKVWNNAKKNLENPQRQERAKKTLMILNHLEQRLKDLDKADRIRNSNLDLTIKMWDRIPQHDLFQGNYSTCCIGMNETNGWSMPVYLLNTAFNMIELVDNETGETVGNALCYFVKDVHTDKPVFIIDNIEIKNSVKPSDEVGKKLRDAITQYAKNIVKDVTEKDNVRILLGTSFNDVPDKDLIKSYHSLFCLGNLEEEVYTDAIDYVTESDVSTYMDGFYRIA